MGQRPARLLFIEQDDADALQLGDRLLGARPRFDVVRARTVAEGTRHARTLPPDAVLIDLTPTDIDDLPALLRLGDRGTRPSVVMLTGGRHHGAADPAPRARADAYLRRSEATASALSEILHGALARTAAARRDAETGPAPIAGPTSLATETDQPDAPAGHHLAFAVGTDGLLVLERALGGLQGILGFSLAEIAAIGPLTLLHHDDRGPVLADLRALLHGEHRPPSSREVRLLTRLGDSVRIRFTRTATFDPATGRLAHVEYTSGDAKPLAAETAIPVAERRTEPSPDELRPALTAVLGFALTLERLDLGADAAQMAERLAVNARRLETMLLAPSASAGNRRRTEPVAAR